MKITTTLKTLIHRLDKAEIKGFQAYLQYKKRKRVLELFNVFVQYEDPQEFDYQIKRKKLVKNLRNNQKDLLKLLRLFWTDNIKKEKPEAEISSLVTFAEGIYEKGLPDEAIKLLKKAEQIAKNHNLHHLAYNCHRGWVVWSWRHYPDATEQMMTEYTTTQEHSINQIKTTSRVTYLNQRIYYLFYKGLWALSKEQHQFLEDAAQEITDILNADDIQPNYEIAMLGLAATHARLIRIDGTLAADYGRQAIAVLNACPPEFPQKTVNLATAYTGLLITLKLIDKREEFVHTYEAFESFYLGLSDPGLSVTYQWLTGRLLNVRYRLHFDAMEATLVAVKQFLENEGRHLAPVFLGHFYLMIFELHYSCGQFDKAAEYLEHLRDVNNRGDLPEIKFMEFLSDVFLSYEEGSHDYIVNRCLSFRRRYSKYLKYNPGGRVLLSYFIKLCNTDDSEQSKTKIYVELKQELTPVLKNIRNRNLLSFWNVFPWIETKMHQYKSIKGWHQNEMQVLEDTEFQN